MYFTKIVECVLCKSSALKELYITRDRHYGIEGEFKIDQCTNCGLVFLNPMPSEQYLNSLYPETYYSYQDFYDKEMSFLKRMYHNFITAKTFDPDFKKAGNFLDIGCGSGKYLYKMRNKGWDVFGVEVNKNAAILGNDLEKLNIHNGNLLSANYDSESFDYVRSNHSFEHITNPNETLDEIYRILKSDGKLFIGVPNIDSFNAKLFKKYWWYLGAPVHPFNYSAKTLTRLLESHGFLVEKIIYNSDVHGTLGSFQIYKNRSNPHIKSDSGSFINNTPLKIISSVMAKLLNFFKKADSIEVICRKNI